MLEYFPDQRFAVSLEAFPVELDGGETVWFTVHVRNFENGALPLSGFVEDEEGAVIKKIGGLEGRIPANGEKNISFSYTVYGVGNYTFKLFLDNYDGKPNGEGEEGWTTVIVEVKPTENVIANMSCNPAAVPLEHSTTFRGHIIRNVQQPFLTSSPTLHGDESEGYRSLLRALPLPRGQE